MGESRKVKKSSKSKTARVYSTALYEAAKKSKCLEKVRDDVVELRNLFTQNTVLRDYLVSPLWKDEDKFDVLKKSAAVLGLNKETLSCMQIVVENRRSADLSAIWEDFIKLYYERKGVAEVEVETAQKLSVSQNGRLQKVLEKILAAPVVVKYHINPAVLGGLRIRCGSKMFDDTLSAKLNYLEKVMKGK